jgi:hypothetical protein
MEIRTNISEIEWMTEKRIYTATFDEFAEANKINSGLLTQSIDLDEEDALPMDQWRQFYEPVPENPNNHHKLGNPKELRHDHRGGGIWWRRVDGATPTFGGFRHGVTRWQWGWWWRGRQLGCHSEG